MEGETPAEIQIQSLLDEAYRIRGNNLIESIRLSEEALNLSEHQHLPNYTAKCLSKLALFQMIRGNYQLSTELSEKAILHFEQTSDEKGLADAKYNIASVHYKTDNYHLGLLNLIDCLKIYKKFNDYHNIGRVYKSLGTIYEYFGDEAKAITAYEETINNALLVGDKNLAANAYNPLSGIYLKKKNFEKAYELAQNSLAIKTETGDTRGYAFAIYAKAKVEMAQGKMEEAEANFQQALHIHLSYNELLGTAMTYRKLGELYLLNNEYEKAKETLIKARDFSYGNHIGIIKYKSNYHLYQLYKKLSQPNLALEYLEEFNLQKELVVNNQTLTIIDNFELLNKVESMKRESEIQKERAEMLDKKNRAENLANIKQDFLSTMSHEIRTPLNAIITIAKLLDGNAGREAEEKQLIQSLNFASNNLLLLVNDILDFTKLETGKMQLEKVSVPIPELFNHLHQIYIGLANEKQIALNLNIDPSLETRTYEIDETRLAQIMSNLIGNAIKYTEAGKIDIGVRLLDSQLEGDKLRFSVEDTGIGIEEKNQLAIFDSFSQMQDIRTRKQGGSGLGLAIVKKLCELHQSEIKIISQPGKGSIFFFDFLLHRTQGIKKKDEDQQIKLADKYVLLVEDNYINAMVAEKLLAKWEIKTKHVSNGLFAIEEVMKVKFDAILMDIHMPEMDGFEATQWIRKHDNLNRDTPILALTADITAENNQDYADHFQVFLRKPIETDKLLQNLVKFIH